MKKNMGFTVIQMLMAVAVGGVLTTIATVTYQGFVAESKLSEAVNMITAQQIALGSIAGGKSCATQPKTGAFGAVKSQGTIALSSGASCPSGCEIAYEFNADGVNRYLNGKVITVSVLNNGKIDLMDSKTTVKSKILDRLVSTESVGDNCATLSTTTPTVTNGNAAGTDVGGSDPAVPVTPPAGGTGGSDPAVPVTPPAGGAGGSDPAVPVTPPAGGTGGDPAGGTDGNPAGGAVVTVNTPILAYFSCERSCMIFNYLILAEHKPASVAVDGGTVEFKGLGFTLGIVTSYTDGLPTGIYGLSPQFKNASDAALINKYSKVNIKVSAPDGTSVSGYFNKLANNVWTDGNEYQYMKTKYGASKFDATGKLWLDLREMIKAKGAPYKGVGYRIESAKITYEFVK